MSNLQRQISAARRQLTSNILFEQIALGVMSAAGVWALACLIDRSFVLGMPLGWSVLLATALALTIALVGTMMRRSNALAAAVALDGAAGLRERLSSAVAFQTNPDAFAQATVRDAERAAGGVRVRQHLPLRAPVLWPYSIAAVLVAVILGLFMPKLDLLAAVRDNDRDDRQRDESVMEEKQRLEAELKQQAAQLQKLEQGAPDLRDLAEDLDKLDLPDKPDMDVEDLRREAAKRLDEMQEKLEQKREELKKLDKLKQQLSKLPSPEQTDDQIDELQSALQQGDFQAAAKALEQMQEKLQEAARKGDEQARQQMQQMGRKMQQLAENMKQLAQDEQRMQKELENKAGMSSEQAKKLLDELKNMSPEQRQQALKQALQKAMQQQQNMTPQQKQQMQQQMQEMMQKIQQQMQAQQACQNMGQCMQQMAQGMQQAGGGQGGQAQQGMQQAMQGMQQAMGQMSDAEMAQQMMNEIDAMMQQMNKARQGVCQGQGRDAMGGKPGPKPGQGWGKVEQKKTAHAYKTEQARTKLNRGQIIGQMLFDGPVLKGEARAAEREAAMAEFDAQVAASRDQDVPIQYQNVVKGYFEALAGLAEREQSKGDTQPSDEAAEAE